MLPYQPSSQRHLLDNYCVVYFPSFISDILETINQILHICSYGKIAFYTVTIFVLNFTFISSLVTVYQ